MFRQEAAVLVKEVSVAARGDLDCFPHVPVPFYVVLISASVIPQSTHHHTLASQVSHQLCAAHNWPHQGQVTAAVPVVSRGSRMK